MKVRCQACGVEKDPAVKEVYPYPEDGLSDGPMNPFLKLDCAFITPINQDWRVATVCHACYHRINPDGWIDERKWTPLDPITPFEDLPAQPYNDLPRRPFNNHNA